MALSFGQMLTFNTQRERGRGMTDSTQTKPLDVSQVRALLVRAVEEKGADYVYDGPRTEIGDCFYFEGERPCCIVGHVFSYLGFGPKDVSEGNNAWSEAHELLDQPTPGEDVRSAAVYALDAAQKAQDSGKTWGEALAAFDEAVKAQS